jgi:O-antigen/teichoic acid export membrane protein
VNATELDARALRGSLWTTLGYTGEQLLRLGGNLVVTRLLFPEAYGWMALVWAVLTGLELLTEMGIRESVVQSERSAEPGFLDALWTFQLLRGLLLFAAACALAAPVARFYGAPELAWLIPVTGLTLPLAGLASTRLLALGRELELARLSALELGAQVVTVAVMIGWAWLRPSVWALAGAPVVGAGVRVVAGFWLTGGFAHRARFERAVLASTLRIGRWIGLSTALGFLATWSDRLILGRLVSPELLGIYTVAFFLSEGVAQLGFRLGQRVLYPTFRKAAGAGALAASYRRARRRLALALLPLAGAVLVRGSLVVELLYDPRYAAAGWMLELLALRIATSALLPPAAAALLALGDARTETLAAGARAVWLLASLPLGFAWAGLPGAVAAVALADLARLPLLWRGLARHALLDPRAELADLLWLAAGAGLAWGLLR